MEKTINKLSQQKLYELLRDNMYEDMVPYKYAPEGLYSSHSNDVLALLVTYAGHHTEFTISRETYDYWMEHAAKEGLTPLFICSTPLGIWQFNLDTIKVEMLVGVVSLKLDKGVPILPWFPEYSSEAEWVASVEDAYVEYMYHDPAEQDLEGMIAELLEYEGDLDAEPLD